MNMIVFAIVLLISLIAGSTPGRSDFDSRLGPIIKPHVFSIAGWEFQTVTREGLPSFFRGETDSGDISPVLEYFASTEQARALEYRLDAARAGQAGDAAALAGELEQLLERQRSLESTGERVLEKQIRDTAAEQGIYNPMVDLRVSFPPVDFKLTRPPHLLVVSPRDRVEAMN